MPLAFETRSHGTIAVGFFNVESDMFLIGHYFLFASDLCAWITSWAAEAHEAFHEERLVYPIREPACVGNLQGAIQGWDLSGFIGAVYHRFPFPQKREEFRQRPEGYETRELMEQLVQGYSQAETILVKANPREANLSFGEYVFSKDSWAAVMNYLWLGGMPRWADDRRPGYVVEMVTAQRRSSHWLFQAAGAS